MSGKTREINSEAVFSYFEYDTNGGCWLWSRSTKTPVGGRPAYGQVRWDGGVRLAHRVFYERFVGPIPEGMVVMHKCDMPPCVNPEHLSLGTVKENMEDCSRKGRVVALKGSKSLNAKMTEEMVASFANDTRNNCEIARAIGVHHVTVSRARRGINWKHVKAATTDGA